MMTGYIKRKDAYELARTGEYYSDFRNSMADLTSLKELLEDVPTANVAEVVHGYWKGIEVKDTCSVCNRSISEIYDADSWIRTEVLSELIACPFCGAVMQNN